MPKETRPYTINLATLGSQGDGREHMEDYIWTEHIPGDEESGIPDVNIFLLADGNGCYPGRLQAEQIVCPHIIELMLKFIDERPDMFIEDPCFFTKTAMLSANKVLGGFKLGDEEKYAGYGVSISVSVIIGNKIYITHTGNTRVYMIRRGILTQLTEDQTKAQEMLNAGKISEDLYYALSDSYVITGGLGFVAEPPIVTMERVIGHNDIYLMTTDGIHMKITPQGIKELVLKGGTCADAANLLIEAASEVLKSEDDMACIVINILA